jgi:predicted glycoside hydrolase/deacetylase ChbG (UPF0249 family)
MDAISLIVRSDEFGLCHAANQAIWEGFESGVVTCAALAVVGPWLAEAAGLIHEHPEWEIGLQLLLHCPTAGCRWGPAAGPAAVPSLVDARGSFLPQLATTATSEDIARELTAQVDRARLWGIMPAFLEFHGTATAPVNNALHALSEQVGVPSQMAGWDLQSILNTDEAQPFEPVTALASLGPGVHLWIVRPAQSSPETWALWRDETLAEHHHTDAMAVCNPEVIALIQRRGIELISFRQHAEARLGAAAEQE